MSRRPRRLPDLRTPPSRAHSLIFWGAQPHHPLGQDSTCSRFSPGSNLLQARLRIPKGGRHCPPWSCPRSGAEGGHPFLESTGHQSSAVPDVGPERPRVRREPTWTSARTGSLQQGVCGPRNEDQVPRPPRPPPHLQGEGREGPGGRGRGVGRDPPGALRRGTLAAQESRALRAIQPGCACLCMRVCACACVCVRLCTLELGAQPGPGQKSASQWTD